MCSKTLLKNIYQIINAGKLWAIRLLKVPFQLLLIIIVICVVVKFFPDKIANFLGIKTDTGEIMSFIELIIEGIFCVLVLKEFKMTRKSFEWQQKEQEKKKNAEIKKQLKVILSEMFKVALETANNGMVDMEAYLTALPEKNILGIPEKVIQFIRNSFSEKTFFSKKEIINIISIFEDNESVQQSQNTSPIMLYASFYNHLRECFNDDKEIEETYEKIVNG